MTAVNGESAQSIVEALSLALRRPVLLDDEALSPVAYSRQWGGIDAVRTDSILNRGPAPAVREALLGHGIAGTRRVLRTPAKPELGMAERVCVPVCSGERTLGYLWLLDTGQPLSEPELEVATGAARLVAAALARAETEPDATALLHDLCSPDPGRRGEARATAARDDLLPDAPVVLCLLDGSHDVVKAEGTARYAARRLSPGHALAGVISEDGAVLASTSDPVLRTVGADGLARWVHAIPSAEIAAGQSEALSLDALPEAVRQAKISLRVARSRPAGRADATWAALGASRVVAQLPASAWRDAPAGLVRLIHDEPALAATLAVFLDTAGDVKAAAAVLSLHRSGLYYRLRRIEELTGLRMDRGDDRLLAHLTIRAAQLF